MKPQGKKGISIESDRINCFQIFNPEKNIRFANHYN